MDLSEYNVEPLRKDGEFTLYRGQHRNPGQSKRSSILLMALVPPHPALTTLRQAERECLLGSELEAVWAVRPIAVVQYGGRPVLVLENPGGEPLDTLIRHPMKTRQFLQIALEKALDEIRRLNDRLQEESMILRKQIDHPSDATIETRSRRVQDGTYRWHLNQDVPPRDANGEILKLAATDIDSQVQAEEELRARETNLRQIVDSIPGLICTMSAAGEVQQLNRPLLKYFGKTSEELKGWKMTDAVHPDDLPEVIKAYTYSVATGTAYEIEHRCRRADGVYRWFQVRASAVQGKDDQIIGWYVLLTDIDDRRRAEEELRIREFNLRQITETIPEMLWSASPDGAIDYCNGRLLDYTGFSLERILRDGWMYLLHPDDVEPTAEAWKSCVRSGDPYRVEVRTFHAADNTYRWCVTRALPLLDQEGRIVRWHGTVVDMQDWKKAQEELRSTQTELARMMRVMTVGQLTASIAHEVNQPLSGVILNASACLRMLKSDPPNIDGARETLQRTIRDGNRASEVITRLRTLFSKKQIDIERLDLNEAAREVIALLSREFEINNVVLKHEFGNHLPAVKGDRVQLQQVILNLLHNGLDAMVTVNNRPRQLLIRTETAGNHVTVSVQDSGIGFSPEIGERLFESFFTTKQEGMGIGLSVSRSIVEAHRGRLWAVRNAGPGATFAFSIPQDAWNIPAQAE